MLHKRKTPPPPDAISEWDEFGGQPDGVEVALATTLRSEILTHTKDSDPGGSGGGGGGGDDDDVDEEVGEPTKAYLPFEDMKLPLELLQVWWKDEKLRIPWYQRDYVWNS